MTTTIQPPSDLPMQSLGGTVESYPWRYQDRIFVLRYETFGTGEPVLLLPAFSTVSTRQEMTRIAQVLASQFQVIALDWLGFGDSARPALRYDRALYCQLLQDFVRDRVEHPIAIIAAGHAAGYALHQAQTQPDSCTKLMLIAPTWKGPLRAMGAPRSVAAGVRNLVRSPLLGQMLYGLNTQPAFLKWMYQRHVYADTAKLTPNFIQHKHHITQQPGSRFAPAAFVTGGLDPMGDRAEWLQVGQSLTLPTKVILAEQAPPQSKAEMEALAALPQIQSQTLPGSLGLHEEYGTEVGAIAMAFLQA